MTEQHKHRRDGLDRKRIAMLALAAVAALLALVSTASAKKVVDYFGTDPAVITGAKGGEFEHPSGIGVNQSGAGPADAGDIYVAASRAESQNRVQRFHHDDNGTPADPYDDNYEFVSAWGADVVRPGGSGDLGDAADADYEICTVAAECTAGVASGGNGTAAGNGDLDAPRGIAVDQDTGNVYVADSGNARVNVYSGDGTFLRSFGWDVVRSGPGNVAAPDERQQLTVKADGGKFSLAFRGATTGGMGTGRILVSKVTEVKTTSGSFEVGQALSAFSGAVGGTPLFPLGTTITAVEPGSITPSNSRLSEAGAGHPDNPLFGDDLPFGISAAQLEAELNALPTIGGAGGSVSVSGGPGDAGGSTPYTIDFGGSLSAEDAPLLQASGFGLMLGSGAGEASVKSLVTGGAHEVCVAAAGDVCQAGTAGAGVGQLGEAFVLNSNGLAITPADGDPSSGTVFLGDYPNRRVNTYDLDGAKPSSFGSAAQFGVAAPQQVAVDSRGIVYASDSQNLGEIERYDSEDANGGGVGFLAPIAAGKMEEQKLTVSATAGTFKLSFDGETTVDLPFDALPNPGAQGGFETPGVIDTVAEALEALPSIDGQNVTVSGGPGNASGSSPYLIDFTNGLGSKDVPQIVASNGTTPLSGGGGASVATTVPGAPGLTLMVGSPESQETIGLAVDPDSDGGGPDTDVLYTYRGAIQQFGPLNAPGLSAPPTDDDARHGGAQVRSNRSGLALDEASGHIFVPGIGGVGQNAHGVYVLHDSAGPPTATLDSIDAIAATSATVHTTINPNGGPPVTYRLEYSTDGSSWTALPDTVLGTQTTPQPVDIVLDPPGSGLLPGTQYHVRLIVTKRFSAPVVSPPQTFTTLAAAPQAETVGTPLRTATTAQLAGRVDPRGAATQFHFEFVTAAAFAASGFDDLSSGGQTAPVAAGSGNGWRLAAARVEGLQPATTYRYRIVADNGSPVPADSVAFTTRSSDAPLSHGHFPGPPGSDRAFEQVSMADSGGNPVVVYSNGFSSDGNRAIYGLGGGNPIGDTGTVFSQYLAERTPAGWQTQAINPPRAELVGPNWHPLIGAGDLSSLFAFNFDLEQHYALFRMSPGAAAVKLHETAGSSYAETYLASADGSRALMALRGAPDPDHPSAAAPNLYDLTTGSPKLVSLLPGGAVSPCGVSVGAIIEVAGGPPMRSVNWLSPDGRLLFIPSAGPACDGIVQLYVRDLDAEATELVSGPPLSGPDCGGSLIKSTPGAAFLRTTSRLAAEDTNPAVCRNNFDDFDVYRYDLDDGGLDCLTCVVAGLDADVGEVAVAPDGSRLYFNSAQGLVPGAPPGGTYRVTVASGEFAYVGDLEAKVGEVPSLSQAINQDGSVLLFRSASPFLNPLGEGAENGATKQYYRYDDRDRSLVCVSCPTDGSAPQIDSPDGLAASFGFPRTGPNVDFLSDAGDFVFRSTEALLPADQNTPPPGSDPVAGMDIYEWRDGRLLLVSDGLTSWPAPNQTPELISFSRSGRDAFFIAPAQLTPDALDGYYRLYDARIGGGFDFPAPPPPCPLEVCQGTPKGAPGAPAPGTAKAVGPGNLGPRVKRPCPKGKRKVRRGGKVRCVKQKRKANHHRRAAR